jgi:ribose transport system substrate-binding protein
MEKKERVLAVLAVLMLVFAITGCKGKEESPGQSQASDVRIAETAVNPNVADYDFVVPMGTPWDINAYYNEKDPELKANVVIRGTGLANVPDEPTTPMPKANKKYTIGFSVYFTVDEVGAMLLGAMRNAANEAGVELLVNDANYDQNAQNQAVEQWIIQKVDGVILAPCDFHGVKDALDLLEKANIPVIAFNAPLEGSTDAIIMSDCVDQGLRAGNILIDYLKAAGRDVRGKVVYQTLPFVHPNAATRTLGFKNAFKDYPGIQFIELTGTTPEEHYAAFEGALQAHPDMIGSWGLYASATVGMMNARDAAKSGVPLTSIDNDKVILAAIKEGKVLGSACYSSIAPAWWSMSLMVNKLNGAEIPSVLWYENKTVLPATVDADFAHYYPGQTLSGYMQTGR